VFDLTNRDSFEALDYYRENLLRVKYDDNKESAVIMLIGNKSDLIDERKVSKEEAEDRARQYDIPYMETSALLGENIDQVILNYKNK
jgi:GTPase SAR1 family protein